MRNTTQKAQGISRSSSLFVIFRESFAFNNTKQMVEPELKVHIWVLSHPTSHHLVWPDLGISFST